MNEAQTRMRQDQEPLCDYIGKCAAHHNARGPVTNCIHCGKELRLRGDGKWYTWDAPPNGGEPQDVE